MLGAEGLGLRERRVGQVAQRQGGKFRVNSRAMVIHAP